MCGICGVVDVRSAEPAAELLERMCAAMVHRGPDDQGMVRGPGYGLAMRRLSIIDVEGGQQPVHNESKTVWAVFNGEIYNYRELRSVLLAHDHTFHSLSDTEVLVHAYEEWGDECIQRLNGMFALAIWDARKRRLLLARDRIGIKPLYYCLTEGDQLAFASELRALVAGSVVTPEVDLAALDQYLALEYVPSPRSILRGVHKLPPGHTLTWRQEDGRSQLRQYWDVDLAKSEGPAEPLTMDEHADRLRSVLRESVRKELVSDVPLGVFLSGGIDSSAVAAAMAELMPGNVNSFSIGFTDPSFDESAHARTVAHHLRTNHHEMLLEPAMLPDLVPAVTSRMDEPLADASIVPTYLLSRFARQHVKVALGGDGGDELFAGYPTLQAHRLAAIYSGLPSPFRLRLIAPLVDRMPVSLDNLSLDFKAKRFVHGASLALGHRHVAWMGAFTVEERAQLLSGDAQAALASETAGLVDGHLARQQLRDPINRLMYLDMKTYLEGDILVKLDRASMMASLEARVPLLNQDFFEHVTALPRDLKLRGLRSKYLLRRALHDILPEAILKRNKKGFGMPVAKWLQEPLREPLLAALAPERIKSEGFFEYTVVRRMLDDHFSGRRDNRKQLWTLFVFERWLESVVKPQLRHAVATQATDA
jgi:asparagine synthase (glutamine-hydrolysing)